MINEPTAGRTALCPFKPGTEKSSGDERAAGRPTGRGFKTSSDRNQLSICDGSASSTETGVNKQTMCCRERGKSPDSTGTSVCVRECVGGVF